MAASDNKKPKARAGAADLAAWSRLEAGEAGTFTNPDTSDWIEFHVGPDDVEGESVFDASRFVDAPSGKHGFLKGTPEGKFTFDDGTPVRFLGGQADVFPEKDYAAWHVKWLRRYGLNFVRGHGFGLPNEERWDRLDYFINECKKGGVYLILTPIYWTEFDVVDPAGEQVRVNSHVIVFFDEAMEQAYRDLWREFYGHENPYTGLRYCDDPTVMAFELKNEDSAFWALSWVKRDKPHYWAKMLRQYAEFLAGKHGSTDGLRGAWTADAGCALEDGETIEDANIDFLDIGSWSDYGNPAQLRIAPRKSDQTEFLHKMQWGFYERSYAYLREIGCKQAICGSNWRGHSYTMRHVLECDSHFDYTDQHDYWDHPQGGWNTEVAVIHNKSMLRSARGGLVGSLAPRQVLGKPYVLTEWNIGSWNEHVQEAGFSMVAYGALHGWSGLLQFTMQPSGSFKGESRLRNRFFNIADNPSVILQYPTLSRLWHRGDVAESGPVFIRRLTPQNLHTPGPVQEIYTPYAFMGGESGGDPEPGRFGRMLAAVGKVANEFTDGPAEHFCDEQVADCLDEEGKVARSVTGELTWDWGRGLCVVDSSMTQGVCGYVGGERIETRDAVFEAATEYCVVMVTSLDDGAPVAESRSILVTALGRARNTGTVYSRPKQDEGDLAPHAHKVHLPVDEQVAILELGEAPIRTEPVRGTITLKVGDPVGVQIHLLDHAGRRKGLMVGHVEGGALKLPLPGEHGVLFYELAWGRG